MISLSATAYFWFITLGLVIGTLFGLMIGGEGVSLKANILWGIGAAVLTGSVGILLAFGDGLLFATAGTLSVLYLVNVFHLHHEEDLSGHVDQGIKIHYK